MTYCALSNIFYSASVLLCVAYWCMVWFIFSFLVLFYLTYSCIVRLILYFLNLFYLTILNCLGLVYLKYFFALSVSDSLCVPWYVWLIFWIRLTYCVLSDVALYNLLLHCLVCWVFPEFALSNLFLHCLTYSVTLIFALTYLYCIDKVCLVWLPVALSDISTISKPRPAYGGNWAHSSLE